MKRHRKDLEIISAINITNLLDTAFILLVAFMIVAPALKSGLQVDLPKVAATDPVEEEIESVTITIYPKDVESVSDRLYVDGERQRIDELERILQAIYDRNPKTVVNIQGHTKAEFGTGMQVFSIANKVGFEGIFVEAEPAGSQTPIEEED